MKKMTIKKIVAFVTTICMLGIAIFSHDKYVGVARAEEYKTITFSDCGIQDGVYSPQIGLFASGVAENVTSMDHVIMTGNVTFPADGGWNAPAVFVGTTAVNSVNGLHVFYVNGEIQVQYTTNNNETLGTVTAQQVGKSLCDVPLEITIAFDYINDADVNVTFSIDGVTYFEAVAAGGVGNFGAGFFVNGQTHPIAISSVSEEEEPVQKEWEEITFSDCGIQDGTYSPEIGLFTSGVAENVTSMDHVVMKGNVTFPASGGWNAPGLFVGTTEVNATNGLHVFYVNGELHVQYTTNNNETLGIVTAEQVEKNLCDVPLELAIAFEYVNATDVKVTFSIDGVTYFEAIAAGGVGNFGAGFFVNGQSNAITISSTVKDEETEPKEWKEISFSDCGIQDGTYSPQIGLFASGVAGNVTSMDHVIMKGVVTFPSDGGWNTPGLFVGTTEVNATNGLHVFYVNGELHVQYTTNNNETLGIVTAEQVEKNLCDVPLELAFAFEYVNATDVKVTFSMDGVTYFETVIAGGVGNFGPGFFVNGQSNAITISSTTGTGGDEGGEGGEDNEEQEWLKVTGEEYSFLSFGYLAPGKYDNLSKDNSFTGDIDKLLNGGVILQKLKVVNGTDGGFVVLFSDPENPWSGIQFRFHDGGTISVVIDEKFRKSEAMPADGGFDIVPENFGLTSFLDTEFELAVAFETAGDNNEDLLMKTYVNGLLCKVKGDADLKNGVMTIPNAAAVIAEGRTQLSMITMFDGHVTLYGTAEEVKKPKLTTVTSADIGLDKATYVYSSNALSICAKYKNSLLNTTYTESITFSEHANNWFHYAGAEAGDATGWSGIRFMTLQDGNIQLFHTDGDTTYILTPQLAGVDKFLGQELQMTLELFEDPSDSDNVLLGVYFNGKLYNGGYFIFKDMASKIGGYVSIYVGTEGGSIAIGEKGPVPTINKKFKKLSFLSFGIHGGNYGYSGVYLAAEGNCGLKKMNRVVFTDTINFGDVNGAQLRFGGAASAWTGLLFVGDGAGNIHLMDAEGAWGPIVFNSGAAGTQLTGQDIELTLSIEYIDYDEDGKKDDVQLGVWFDGKAYGDAWIYLTDYAAKLGGNCGIYCSTEEAMMTVSGGPEPVDFYEYGFTNKWAKELRVKELFE